MIMTACASVFEFLNYLRNGICGGLYIENVYVYVSVYLSWYKGGYMLDVSFLVSKT